MSEIVEKPEEYFRKLVPERDKLMIELEAQAEKEDIPLFSFLPLHSPEHDAICMAVRC